MIEFSRITRNLFQKALLMNKTLQALVCLTVACSLATTFARAEEQQLFNGTDLTGWDGAPGWWRVEDGA